MAGKISAKGAVIVVDDSAGTPRTITSAVRSYELKQDAGKIEITGLGDGSKNYTPGLPVQTIILDMFWDSTATTGAWTVVKGDYMKSTSTTISITPEVGGQTWTGEYMLSALPVKGTPSGALEIGSTTWEVMGSSAGAWA